MRKRHYIQILLIFISLQVKGQPFSYDDKVQDIIDSKSYKNDLLSYHDTINNELIEYTCNDTLFSDSCSFSRLIRLNELGNIVCDSSAINNSGYSKFRKVNYFENCAVIKTFRYNARDKESMLSQTDSLILDENGNIIEYYWNNKIKDKWLFDKFNRLVKYEMNVSEKRRTNYKIYQYLKDTIIEKTYELNSWRGIENNYETIYVFDSNGTILKRLGNGSSTKYYSLKGQINMDSVISKNINPTYTECYKYYGTDSVLISNSVNEDYDFYKYQDSLLVEHFECKKSIGYDSLLYVYEYIHDFERVYSYDKSILRSIITRTRYPSGEIKEYYSKSFGKDKKEYITKKVLNRFGKTIFEYRLDLGQLLYCNLTIEK